MIWLLAYSQVVIVVVLEAVQSNFDHRCHHESGGITKHDSFVPYSALPSSLEMKATEKGVSSLYSLIKLDVRAVSDRTLQGGNGSSNGSSSSGSGSGPPRRKAFVSELEEETRSTE
ncbi:uncharacterized protein V6R79_015249 [Siganus canaliculatus]